ncbi:SH2 domain-containing protein 6 isoform X2 [Chrysemys picta bellii]|uniref:SH2 domain-containing protein 6 isoform X2 n=1 Tax=Chrysemys picta bellii TaxID=8478 RepID=UPI0032B13BEC
MPLPGAARSPLPSCRPSSCQSSAWCLAQTLAMERRCPRAWPAGKVRTEPGRSSPQLPAVAGSPCPSPFRGPRQRLPAPLHPGIPARPRGTTRYQSLPPTYTPFLEGPPEEQIYLVCEPSSPPPCRMTRALMPPLGQVPPPKPPKLSKPKIALPGAHQSLADSSPEASSKAPAWPRGSGSPVEDPGMQDQAWYAGSCDRHLAESILQGVNKDSAFMVRQSSGQGWNQPFTLAVLYKGHVYNIPIRYVESSRQYALGKDGKSREERFDSVAGIIQHYREHPLVLIEGSSASRAHTCLLFPVKP